MRELKGDWRDIFKCFRIALDYRKMTLAFQALLLTALGLILIAILSAAGADESGVCAALLRSWEFSGAMNACFGWWEANSCEYVGAAFSGMLSTTIGALVWLIFVWSYFGAGIARIAAVEIAKDERIDLREAEKFARKKYRDLLLAVVLLVFAFLFFFGCNWFFGGIWRWLDRLCMLIGLTSAADTSVFVTFFAPVFLAIFLPLAILSGFIMVLIVIGSIFGYHLFPAVIGAEGTDYFDAISRAFNYVFARPWHYIWYHLAAIVHGAISILFVGVFTCAMVNLGVYAGRLGLGQSFDKAWDVVLWWHGGHWAALGAIWGVATFIMMAWLFIIAAYAVAYIFSYCYSATTMIYFLLRKSYDGVEMTEVFEEEEEGEEWKLPEPTPPPPAEEKKPEAAAPAPEEKKEGPCTAPPPEKPEEQKKE